MFYKKLKAENSELKAENSRLKEANRILSLNLNILDEGIITPDIAKKLTIDSVTEDKVNKLIKLVDTNIRKQTSFGRNWSPYPSSVDNQKVFDVVKEYYKSKGFVLNFDSFNWK